MKLTPYLDAYANPTPGAPFDSYEIQLVAEHHNPGDEGSFVEPVLEECETDGDDTFIAAYYSVYGHFNPEAAQTHGGRQCIADFDKLEHAHELLMFMGVIPKSEIVNHQS